MRISLAIIGCIGFFGLILFASNDIEFAVFAEIGFVVILLLVWRFKK